MTSGETTRTNRYMVESYGKKYKASTTSSHDYTRYRSERRYIERKSSRSQSILHEETTLNTGHRKREKERDRSRNIEIGNDGYGDQDRPYKKYKGDETEVYRGRVKKDETVKVHVSNIDSSERCEDDLEKRISLKLTRKEDEEEELKRIIEESRKIRQAVTEKYKSLPVDVINKDNSPVENNGLQLPTIPPTQSQRSDDSFRPIRVHESGKGEGLPVIRDDAEGYYSYRIGEILDGRYQLTQAHGKGVFSNVVRAKDLKADRGGFPDEVAIKIIRNNEEIRQSCQQEVRVLRVLADADPDDKRHCVRFSSSFKHRNHLCLVFEPLHMNLRQIVEKFGCGSGLKLSVVKAYAKQLLIALQHLKDSGVLHCDIKPDNILVNEAKNVLKLCDFGSAMFAGRNEITPILVSRFYRPPEVILGLPYDHQMDMWSVGCCLYELYTGKILFPGGTNNDMLRLFMELKGPFRKKMLLKGAFTEQHFDQNLNFHAAGRMVVNIKTKGLSSIIIGSSGENPKMVADFRNLLEKIFVLDPRKRMTVTQALAHPFITGK